MVRQAPSGLEFRNMLITTTWKRRMNRVIPALAAAGWLLALAARAEQAPGVSAAPVACEDLAGVPVAHTAVTAAETVATGAFTPPPGGFDPFQTDYSVLPAFCRVTGSISPVSASDIRFELWLPESGWNNKFLQAGNGAAAGSMSYFAMVQPLSRGYAVAHTDTGHRGAGGDFSWAAGHPEQLTDYQYRAVRELTIAGKALTAARYGSVPRKSYFVGCSTGGRQGLLEAQRYPDDYDAIIASAPAHDWSRLMALSIVIERNLGPGGLAVEKLSLLTEGALAACDAGDGVRDRVITEPGACGFDPAGLLCEGEPTDGCLDEAEVAAARRIYAGLVSGDGTVAYPGTGPGSEALWAFYASPFFKLGSSYFRHVIAADPEWDAASFDADRDLDRALRHDSATMNAVDPDLSVFVARGGKLLLNHGTTDGIIPYRSTVNYYESVVAELGGEAIADSVRFYLVPGMDHCAAGRGAAQVDWLTALEQWAEHGRTPGVLAGAAAGQAFTRPICPWPQLARYRGGDETDAASFECSAP